MGSGVPARYDFTSRAFHALSPWNDATFAYSILQLKLGSNFNSRLEVVSSLNLFNQARCLYYFNYLDSPSKYAPKVYLGTTQTIAYAWNFDLQNIQKFPENWPQNSLQKGEA